MSRITARFLDLTGFSNASLLEDPPEHEVDLSVKRYFLNLSGLKGCASECCLMKPYAVILSVARKTKNLVEIRVIRGKESTTW